MEKYPSIDNGQFTIQFIDRNTGHVLDQHLKLYANNAAQQVYVVCNTLQAAITSAGLTVQTNQLHTFNVGYYIRNSNGQVVLHTDNTGLANGTNTKTIFINGANFADEAGFYNEAASVLTSDLNWTPGHSLNAWNDLLRGGFGVHEYEEPIQLVWLNAGKSRQELNELWEGKTFYEAAVTLIKTHSHIAFKEK